MKRREKAAKSLETVAEARDHDFYNILVLTARQDNLYSQKSNITKAN